MLGFYESTIFQKNSFLLLFCTIFSTSLALSQDFRPGYVINAAGDTLYGEINYSWNRLLAIECTFRNLDQKIQVFKPFEINAFRLWNGRYFVSRTLESDTLFLEMLVDGELDIYYLSGKNGDHYFVEKEDNQLLELTYKEFTESPYQLPANERSLRHIGLLNYYTGDVPSLQGKINKISKPNHSALIDLAESYHKARNVEYDLVKYYKSSWSIKIGKEVISGVERRKRKEDSNFSEIRGRFGVLLHVAIPKSNEKLFFKTGILFSANSKSEGAIGNGIKVPLHLEYMVPGGKNIRPFVSMGLLLPSYSAGLNFPVNPKMNFGIQGWADFYPVEQIFIMPKELYSFSLNGSFSISL